MTATQRLRSLLALGVVRGVIYSIDLDDGSCRILHRGVGAFPDGVQVIGETIFWTTMGRPRPDVGGGLTAVGRVLRDGDGPVHALQSVAEGASNYSHPNGGVHAIGIDGTHQRTLTAPGTIVTGKQLASDGRGWLYLGDREGCRVSRVRTDGTDLQHLVVNDPAEGESARCVGVAVDPDHGKLYWTQKGPAKGGRGQIFRVDLELAPGETPQQRTTKELLWDELPEPIDLEIHGDWLYWTDRGAPPAGNTLNRAPLPGAGERGGTPEILADGFNEAIGLAVDTAAVYVSDLGGHIYAVDLPGGEGQSRAKRLVADVGTPVSGIVGLSYRV